MGNEIRELPVTLDDDLFPIEDDVGALQSESRESSVR